MYLCEKALFVVQPNFYIYIDYKMRSYKIHNKTRKAVTWAGWGKLAPQGAARTRMYKKCGKKCFLGTKKSFPI